MLCLLEVARRASRFGMASPVLIQLEQEIEEEIREEMEDLPAQPKPQRSLRNIQNLDEMVMHHKLNSLMFIDLLRALHFNKKNLHKIIRLY